MKKILIGLLTAAAIFFQANSPFATPNVTIPEEIYKWVQSTPRAITGLTIRLWAIKFAPMIR